MRRLTDNKILLVVRETRLDDLVARFNTRAQAAFYIEHLGGDFAEIEEEHDRYQAAIAAAEDQLQTLGRLQVLERRFLPNFIFGEDDLVVVLGQDGLVANTLKYLEAQSVVGVNPDPNRYDGVLLPFQVADLPGIVPEVFRGGRKITTVTMAQARLSDGQNLYAVNDLFVGARTHVSARYQIAVGDASEHHSSSGIIVSTGLGSTGWFRSVVTGAAGVARALGHVEIPDPKRVPWHARVLMYSVREPFPSARTSTDLVLGKVTEKIPLRLVSEMAGNGVIFSDGMEADFLAFNAGMEAVIGPADKTGRLVA